MLTLDARARTAPVQYALGGVTFALLLGATATGPPADRRPVWLCVALATAVELFGSILWGVYRYRLGNVPLYVPPGHGLVYVFGLRAARLPPVLRHARAVRRTALGTAALWAAAGLTVLPPLTHRLDVFGAGFFVYFAVFMLRTQRQLFFAAIFVATSALELAGTGLGDWRWAPVAPGLDIPVGNPPSVIAGGYCVLDALVILTGRLLGQVRPSRRAAAAQPRPEPGLSPTSAVLACGPPSGHNRLGKGGSDDER